MKKLIAVAAFALTSLTPVCAMADWHRGFVVDWYEIAAHWSDDPATTNVIEDVNCTADARGPVGPNPEPPWERLYKTDWRSAEEVAQTFERVSFGTPLANRGPRPGMNVHRDPTLTATNPLEQNREVSGPIAKGFDLDNNPATGGFTSPDGRRTGIDNGLYRAVGCFKEYYGSPHETGRASSDDINFYNNDEMRVQGMYTVLIMVSGKGDDPRNDPNVTVGFYIAKEPLELMANSEISSEVSYRIDPDPRFMSVFEARSVNGLITPRAPLAQLNIRDHGARPYHTWDLELVNPQIEMSLKEDGRLEVLLGGYRNWKQFYWGWAAAGNTTENARAMSLPGLWNSLERHADGVPDPTTGKMTHISATYRMEAVPAFLITPETNQVVTVAQLFTGTPRDAGPVAQRIPRDRLTGSLGGNANFYLDGGAAAWPHQPRPELVQTGTQMAPVAAAETAAAQ